ncbi:MAG: hypothetical protein HZB15_16610, partial [Actinobacteria bacterium]|nr:hypothetical protein [Actinomycetota bacterium]
WRRRTRVAPEVRARELSPYCAGFLFTVVEREGGLAGTDLDAIRRVRAATDLPLTAAGGITTEEELLRLDRLGIDAQVGMAIYTGKLDLAAGDDKAEVELTLNSTDTKLSAAIAVTGGVVLGLCSKWLLGVFFPLRSLRKRLDDARRAALEQQTKFEATVDQQSWTISASVEKAHRDGVEALGAFARWKTLSIDKTSPSLVAANAALASLAKSSLWGEAAAKKVNALRTAVRSIGDACADDVPALHQTASKHLETREVALDDIEKTLAATLALTTALNGMAEIRSDILRRLRDLSQADPRKVEATRADLRALLYRLWRAETVEEVTSLHIDERLAKADEVIGALTPPGAATSPAPTMTMSAAFAIFRGAPAVDVVGAVAPVIDAVAGVVGWIGSQASRFTGVALRGLAAVAVIALVVGGGVLTGLETVYGDGPFGTFFDYLGAVAWGVAAAAILQGIESAVGALNGSTVPAASTAAATTTTATT